MKAGGIGTAALAAAGLIAMGAARAPSDASQLAAARAALVRALPTPRLFRMTRTGGGPLVSANMLEMCLGADFVDRLIGGAAPGKAPAAGKGCSHSYVARRGGGFHLDVTCDRSAGAARTTHMVLDGTVKDLRQSMEVVLEDPQGGDPRIVSMDLRMTDMGPCPAGLAPGQARTADGRIVEAPDAKAGRPERPASDPR